jgi:hypothetical protein
MAQGLTIDEIKYLKCNIKFYIERGIRMTNKNRSKALVLFLTVCLALSSFAIGALASGGGQPSSVEDGEPHTFIVAFKTEHLPDNYLELVQQAGGTVTYAVPQIGVIEATTNQPTGFIKEMLKDRNVLSLGPSVEVQLDLPEVDLDNANIEPSSVDPVPADEPIWGTGWQWDIEQVTNHGASHDISTANRKDVVVAVIDTGFDFNHPDLKDYVDLEGSRTFVPGTVDSWDAHSHGTHVAGTIGSQWQNKRGRSWRHIKIIPCL